MNNKRLFIIAAVIATVIILSVVIAVVMTRNDDDDTDVSKNSGISGGTPRERALRVLDKMPIIDGHNDLPWMYQSYQNQVGKVSLFFLHGSYHHSTLVLVFIKVDFEVTFFI